MFEENLDLFFNDFGVPVVIGTSTFTGILDMPDELIASGLATGTVYQLTMKTSDIPNLKPNQAMTVNGVSYLSKEIYKADDGQITKVMLSKV